MGMINVEGPKPGDRLVNLDEKVFPDHQASDGDRALIMTTTRIIRKGFSTTLCLYGPGVLMAAAGRGFPDVGAEGFPGNLSMNKQIDTIMNEGGTVHACRFAMVALYGMRESDIMEGVKPFHPLDVLDGLIDHWRDGALTIATWTV